MAAHQWTLRCVTPETDSVDAILKDKNKLSQYDSNVLANYTRMRDF